MQNEIKFTELLCLHCLQAPIDWVMLISRSISKVWEENSYAVDYIPAYHIKKEL